MKDLKNTITLHFLISWFIVFLILGFFLNYWFLLGSLISLIIIGYLIDTMTINTWNKGICIETSKPWEFLEYGDLLDGDTTFIFKSDTYRTSMNKSQMTKLLKEYKGENELKGL